MNTAVVKKDFSLETLDRERVDQVQVSRIAGGVSFASALEVMEFSKLMALDETGPDFLFKNPGTCIRVCFQAIEWGMSPFGVADKAYKVGKKLAYESQLIHAVIEARAPLQKRLRCRYEGDGPTLKCFVWGTFIGETEPHEYESPTFAEIKIKNSPLWVQDPKQQLFYYASRAWARRWAPDVLLGIYTREELQANATLAAREDEAAGNDLHMRLAAGSSTTDEGHQGGKHIEGELANIGTAATRTEILPSDKTKKDEPPRALRDAGPEDAKPDTKPKRVRGKKKPDATTPAAEQPQAEPSNEPAAASSEPVAPSDEPKPTAPAEPTTAADYQTYAARWIDNAADKDDAEARWDGEREMRKALGVSLKVSNALRSRLETHLG